MIHKIQGGTHEVCKTIYDHPGDLIRRRTVARITAAPGSGQHLRPRSYADRFTDRYTPLSAVNEAGGFLIEIMPMLFIPAGVGLMVSWGALKPVIIPISIIIVVTTILVMAVSGRIAQFILKKEDKKHE